MSGINEEYQSHNVRVTLKNGKVRYGWEMLSLNAKVDSNGAEYDSSSFNYKQPGSNLFL